MAVGNPHGEQPDASVTVVTEAGLASMFAGEGRPIVLRDGRYWRSTFPGFYEPLHFAGRMRVAQVKRPSLLCWGYRAALDEEDAGSANGSIPLHLLADVEQYTERLLSENRRRDLRKCRRLVEFVRLRDPTLLLEQGYGVLASARRRLGYERQVAETDYLGVVKRHAADGRRLLIAGLVDGRLGGYIECYAVDAVLYVENIHVATDALRTGIATGLYVETFGACARAGTIHAIVNGLQRSENPDLLHFKDSLGFRRIQVPARVVIPGPIRVTIKRLRPDKAYRLMGVAPDATAGTQESFSETTPNT